MTASRGNFFLVLSSPDVKKSVPPWPHKMLGAIKYDGRNQGAACSKDQVLHRWACLKWNFLGGNSIRNLLLSASFYCKIYCSREQQNPVSRPTPNLVSHSSNHYKAAEILSGNFYLISKTCGGSYWHIFTVFRFAFKWSSFSFVNFLLMSSNLEFSEIAFIKAS